MAVQPLMQTAFTVERFLDAARIDDGRQRTQMEEWLTQWLAATRGGYAVYHRGNVYCYEQGGAVARSFSMAAQRQQPIWCDGKKLSLLDEQAYLERGALVMLGTAGLLGSGASRAEYGVEVSSNNNNNNNNNNNG